jgi:aspartate aminotransferase
MSSFISDRSNSIQPSATLAMTQVARDLKAAGKDVISLTVGEPDFDTPDFIRQAAKEAIDKGLTHYPPVDGYPALKQAIIDKFQRDNQLTYNLDQVIVSTGAKQCLYNIAQAVLNPSDEAIIPAPYWVSYPDIVKLAGGIPVIVTATIEQEFKITPEQLEAAITPKTKLFMFNSPSNPTSKIYTESELKALADVLVAHPHVLICSDDIYEHITWSEHPFKTIAQVCPALDDRTITLNGVSKAYAMTGWRIGYCAGPAMIIKQMKKIQGQSTSGACSIAQAAATAALDPNQQACLTPMVQAFKERHDYMYSELKAIAGVKVSPGDGAFYLFPNIQAVIDKMANIEDDIDFCQQFIETQHVAITAGSAFGMPGCVRFSFANSLDNLKEAMVRFKHFIDE